MVDRVRPPIRPEEAAPAISNRISPGSRTARRPAYRGSGRSRLPGSRGGSRRTRIWRRPLALLPLLAAGCAHASIAPAQTRAGESAFTSETLAGLELRTIGPAVMSGRIVDLAVVEGDSYVWYVATATGGVWKTTNNGVTFTPVFENRGTHSVGDIAVHPRDTSVVWVGTGERANRQSNSWGDGVYKSTDGGRTWRHMGLEETRHIGRIRMHPQDPDIVYVAAMGHLWGPNEERGLYRSTDGGESWEKVLYVDENSGVVDVAIDPERPEILYAASYQRRRRPYAFHGGGPGSALWKSTDGGDTWERLTQGLPGGMWGRIGIDIYRRDPRIVYISLEKGYRYNASTAYVERAHEAGIFRSEDRGETWRHMGDWNPRPMYASQIRIDPNDDCVLYMENEFSRSTDCGKSFEPLEQSLHGDDRFVWIDPNDSRHLIKADDGGVGISYDRGETWLYVSNLPVSQFYHVRVDNRDPYYVYGGLQDNGSWVGPNATYHEEGVLNSDWIKTGGGDGFLSIPDTVDPSVFYAESQYLGLERLDWGTWRSQDIRPGDPRGHISARRNYDWFFAGDPVEELENAMAPANWDGPYIISPHDNDVLYAGTDHLWKSTDRGLSWTDLGRMTSDIDRRELTVMGQEVRDSIPSIDDGVPYWPTITAVAESPMEEGVLYVGTDDGRLRVSRDGGGTWTDLQDRVPGLPDTAWISGIEPSRHAAGRVYVAVHNYQNDDYGNYLWRSDDYGQTWRAIVGDLPAGRVLRTVREDPRNPDLLWLGTELGLFVTIDGGAHWVELRNNLPTLAFNDLVVHPRDNDLVLASHGRGIWLLDQVNAIQELSPEILAGEAHLFTIEPAAQIRYTDVGAHTGDMWFAGENPPEGAILDYYLREAADSAEVSLTIHDAAGEQVHELEPELDAGINRVTWNLRYADLPLEPGECEEDDRPPPGPWVVPGTYTARLTVGGRSYEQPVEVRDDPRLDIPAAERRAWTESVLRIVRLYRAGTEEMAALLPLARRLEAEGDTAEIEDAPAAEAAMAPSDSAAENVAEVADPDLARGCAPQAVDTRPLSGAAAAEVEELNDQLSELYSRIGRLYFNASSWTGPLTADQQARLTYYEETLEELRPRVRTLVERLTEAR